MKTKLTWSQWLTITGIVIALANMALAWIVLLVGPGYETGASQIFSNPPQKLNLMKGGSTAGDAFDFQLLSGLARWALSKGQLDFHELVLILGLAFTLMAIGFSFFVMGIESAINVKGGNRDFGWIVVKTTSPGWIAILLSGLLMGLTVYSRGKLPIDPKTSAQAQLIRAQAEAKLREAEAQEILIRAKADAEDTTSMAKQGVLEAKADLIEAKATAARTQSSKPAIKKTKSKHPEN
jgi:hypothetical protein